MQTVGPRRIWADFALTSWARCWPTWCSRLLFHVAAKEIPQGNNAAYLNISFLYTHCAQQFVEFVPTFVPPTKIPPRAPFGPSLVFAAGIPFSLIALVLQKSAAVRREILHDISKSVSSQRESGNKHTFSSCVSSDSLSTAQALSFWELCLEEGENGTEPSVSGVEQTPLLLREGVCKGDVVESKSLSMMTYTVEGLLALQSGAPSYSKTMQSLCQDNDDKLKEEGGMDPVRGSDLDDEHRTSQSV